ncbi:2-amino-4-hydroxy-6-hydroxymethyldihydropteridine diphosphokinase [Virgibacillus sp. W0181]|uniref:2-amino-4-hydroxy-6- hydroxymethyldihydropteridine diphosphokinase n=1 Tax=Virgibacillus sp. W0181 TaxID=3391581 RepID=UPI003F447B11
MNEAFIALGTNIEPREQHLNSAIATLSNNCSLAIKMKSSIYETAPVGFLDQADFLNMVIHVSTALSAEDLLDACQAVENELGRKRTIRNGPRTIDLDIVLFNQETIQTNRLTVPHPRMNERAFVLVPLNEIAADFVLPDNQTCVKELLKALPLEQKDDISLWKKEIAEH